MTSDEIYQLRQIVSRMTADLSTRQNGMLIDSLISDYLQGKRAYDDLTHKVSTRTMELTSELRAAKEKLDIARMIIGEETADRVFRLIDIRNVKEQNDASNRC